jgi:hypothetical protein
VSTNLNHKIAALAWNEMMASQFFSICAVDKAATLLGCSARSGMHYEALQALHCIHWNKMPKDVREAIPLMIAKCLELPPQFRLVDEMPPADSLPLVQALEAAQVRDTPMASASAEQPSRQPLLKRIFARLAA